jgi:hypothetical protein
VIDAGIVGEAEAEAAHLPPHPHRVVGDVLLVDVPGSRENAVVIGSRICPIDRLASGAPTTVGIS